MTPGETTRTRQASKDALKAIYYVIIGIAITEALSRTFLDRGDFLGRRILDQPHRVSTFLLLAFLPTAIRFVHGASIHLDAMYEKGYKPALDFVGFLTQGSLFYLMATTLGRPGAFAILFGLMLLFDAIWLLALRSLGYVTFGATEWQWIVSDGILIGCLLIVVLVDRPMTHWLSMPVVVGAALLATLADYGMNRTFYFPASSNAAAGSSAWPEQGA